MAGQGDGGTFEVSMLDTLREPFERWLRNRGLLMVHVPETAEQMYAVVPDPDWNAILTGPDAGAWLDGPPTVG